MPGRSDGGSLTRAFSRARLAGASEVAAAVPAPAAVIELGCGPGVALAELLRAYPAARVIGADPSAVVLTSARRRNACALGDGRVSGRKRYPA